ncbi:hypothetical protein FKW77_001716 [Venturia effusa]|uniref:Uncharacterized protein n=1 Tax=Venturia effusa TaxID=50376 RepID=A0A517L8N2_9PEZI|nr:hypothetical protein FKW77_001716 [Venturia effusa]
MLARTIVVLFGQYALADHILYARYTNTSSASTSTKTSSTSIVSSYTGPCTPDCQAVQESTQFYWAKQVVTATILAAKIILVFNKATNKTRTETSYYPLPAGHTLPPTNAAGAHVTTIYVNTFAGDPKKEIVLAYPTELGVANPLYSWQGTLPTIDAMGKSVCSTVQSPSHVTIPYQATLTPSFDVATKDKEDPFGYIYSLDSPVCFLPADSSINPDDAAPKLCQGGGVCGAHAEQTALYLTETSSSVESVTDAANTQVSKPRPNTPATNPTTNTPAPKPNNPDPAHDTPPQTPNSPVTLSVQNTLSPQQNTSPDAAANIGALLTAGSQPTPTQVGATQPIIPQPTAATSDTPSQPAASPSTQNPSLPSISSAAVIVIGSSSIIANSDSVFVVGGQSLSPGGAVIVDGTSITLGSAGQVAVVGEVTQQVQTIPVAQSNPTAPAPVVSVGGQAFTANSNSAFVIAGQTVAPESAVVIAGTTISVLPSAGGVVVNGATQTFEAGPQSAPSPVLTLNGQTYAANSQSVYVIAGQTLAAGKSIVVSGTTVVLASAGEVAVVNGVTQTVASSPVAALLTIGGQTLTANPQSGYIISSQTLAPGHPITIGTGSTATTLRLATDSAGHPVVVVNSMTSTLGSAVTLTGASNTAITSKTSSTSTEGIGDFIASGIGFSSAGTSQSTSMATTAGAGRIGCEICVVFLSFVSAISGVLLWI